MEEKDIYTLKDLFDNLPISLAELSRRSQINVVTIGRIRDEKVTPMRSTANRLLRLFSEIYGKTFTLSNVDIKVRG
jgi:predicted transcriptional regulator